MSRKLTAFVIGSVGLFTGQVSELKQSINKK